MEQTGAGDGRQLGINRLIGLAAALPCLILFCAPLSAWAGGPRWVAGSSYFDPAAKGHPIVWKDGQVTYFTDLGALSSAVSQAQANTMVAHAAAVWNGVSTAAVDIRSGGSLGEDVSGSNVTAGSNGHAILPADVQPTATDKPVAVIYDQDGSVIDALYGAGASSPLACENNGVMATVDNFAPSGNLAHARILVNGRCAVTTDQIANIQYQLIRAFGLVLGLGWSQANEQMFIGAQITDAGLAGWPIMHPIERLCNGGGGLCMPNATQLRTDDVAALNRLYPVTSANIGDFIAKVLTASATVSVRGTIQFPRGQGMQGVNVVLRPVIDGTPEIQYTATAVSGAYFQGNAGNPVTGGADQDGNPLNRFGSDDPSLEGYFDLSGVPLPPGTTAADYQLSFEPINPLYTGSSWVGPYTTGQVSPSGTLPVIDLGSLSAGSSVTREVVVQDAADEGQSCADGSEFAPAQVPMSGEWTCRMTGYGHTSWFEFWARGAREFTIEAEALDASGAPSENKVQVVLGAWNGTDSAGSPPVTGTPQPFNGAEPGLTTLPVLTSADSEVRIGAADLRGDGRPDYAWRGRILYADSVTPARLPASGGQIVIRGMGFLPGMTVAVNQEPATIVSVSPNAIVAVAPPSGGATGDVLVSVQDPTTLGVAAIADGLSYDAHDDDAISLVTVPPNVIPIGVPQNLTVRAINVTSQTPAQGVTVTFAVTGGTAALGCGRNSCSAVTAADGTASLSFTANSTALARIAASLTNGSAVIAQFEGSVPETLTALTPKLYVAMGATVQWPVKALVLDASGVPAQGEMLTWSSASGAKASAAQSASSANGIASNTVAAGPLQVSAASSVSACLQGTATCAAFQVIPVQPSTEALIAWSGANQYIPEGQGFGPVVLRVVDAFGNPVAGAGVAVSQALYGWTEPCPPESRCPAPPLLAQQTGTETSGLDGLVTVTPLSAGNLAGRLVLTATAGTAASVNVELEAYP